MKKYSRLILILALLLVGCKSQKENDPFSWGKYSCTFTGEYDSGSGFLSWTTYPPTYNGTFRCTNADGSNLTCPDGSPPAKRNEFSAKLEFPRDFSDENFWKLMGCGAAPAVTSTPTPSPVPTATSTPMPTATLPPLLSGEVSACNKKDGFINFKLATISPLVNESDILLTINGTQVSCTFAGSDNSLLSCPLPAGSTFPAQIHVSQGNVTVNDFTYDGGGCVVPAGPSGDAAPTKHPGSD